MPRTGSYSVPVKYSVMRLRQTQRMMPMKHVQAGRMSSPTLPKFAHAGRFFTSLSTYALALLVSKRR
jgi:hypothetical protein